MSTKAYDAMEFSVGDVDNLLAFHKIFGGDKKGRRPAELQSLNKSAVVMLCAVWEAYIEDVVIEIATNEIQKSKTVSQLPLSIKKLVVSQIQQRKKTHELAELDLAGLGWKKIASESVLEFVGKFNTPKSIQVNDIFERVLGIRKISDCWTWHKNKDGQPTAKINKFVELRGAIAHGRQSTPVNKNVVLAAADTIVNVVVCIENKLIGLGRAP